MLVAGLPPVSGPVLPIGQPWSFTLPDNPGWIGARFGVQALVVTDFGLPAGQLCNALLANVTQ